MKIMLFKADNHQIVEQLQLLNDNLSRLLDYLIPPTEPEEVKSTENGKLEVSYTDPEALFLEELREKAGIAAKMLEESEESDEIEENSDVLT